LAARRDAETDDTLVVEGTISLSGALTESGAPVAGGCLAALFWPAD